jgi:hypothetical protein
LIAFAIVAAKNRIGKHGGSAWQFRWEQRHRISH